METVNIFLLHGFLGRPKDWQPVIAHLPQNSRVKFFTPDLFNDSEINSLIPLDQWGSAFVSWVRQRVKPEDKNILVGYSMGGRLALHALEKGGRLFSKIMIVSANTGIRDGRSELSTDSLERKNRWINDSNWAELFSKAPWEDVLNNWNSQSIFGEGVEPQRSEEDYSRESLSLALTQWSLAQQKDFRPVVFEHVDNICWVVGSLDDKYVEIANSLRQDIKNLQVEVIENASHRVLFDQAERLAEKLAEKISLFIAKSTKKLN